MAKKVKLTTGNDEFVGSRKAERIFGMDGDDSISASGGNDTVYGGAGNDVLKGGAGEDKLYGGEGNDLLLGGAGDDLLSGGAGTNTVDGGEGDDSVVLGYAKADATKIEKVGGDTIITGKDGSVTTIRNVEVVRFTDGSVLTGDLAPTTPPTGKTFTLTVGADTLEGTDAADTFRAVTANSLETVDSITGGAGDDVLNIAALAIPALGAAPVMSGVERINNAAVTEPLNLGAVSGLTSVWSTNAVAASTQFYDDASLTTTFGASNSATTTINIDIKASTAGLSDTLMLAADDNNANTATFTSTDDAGTIENLSIAALGEAGGSATGNQVDDIVNVNGFTAAKAITVTGAGDISVVANTIATLTTVNASAATGAVTVSAAAATGSVTFTGGTGVDTFTGGIVADTFVASAGADVYTGGTGNDTFGVQGLLVIGAYDRVTDWAATDLLEFGGAAGTAGTYTEVGAAAASFGDALNAANLALDAGVVYASVVLTGTGVLTFADTNADGTADQVVELTGATLAQIDWANIA